MDETYKLIIPWGIWDIETGYWYPNQSLKMSAGEQYQRNIDQGIDCYPDPQDSVSIH